MTSGPVLGALAEAVSDGKCDVAGVVDATQMKGVFHQWELNGNSEWKMPAIRRIFANGRFTGKNSMPYGQGDVHDFMHAKVVVADDYLFTGSYNLSHSGEQNAENVLEVERFCAGRPARGVRGRDPRALPGRPNSLIDLYTWLKRGKRNPFLGPINEKACESFSLSRPS